MYVMWVGDSLREETGESSFQFSRPVPCTTNLAEHTQAFLGKPGLTEPQLAIRVQRYHDARFTLNSPEMFCMFSTAEM